MKRMYQYLKIPGKELSYEGYGRDKSKFWDKGKWDTFINPFISEESLDFPFLEIGSNSGLFLSLAEKKGFRHVYGIERSSDRVMTAEWYKDSVGGNYKILEQQMDSFFDWNQLPRMGVTLIANTHYYMPVVDFGETISALRDRTLYCIIVSVNGKKRQGCASRNINDIRGYFNDWTEIGVIENIDVDGDPSPREGMYGIIFKSNLELLDLEKWFRDGRKLATRVKTSLRPKYVGLLDTTEDFYSRLATGEEFDVKDSLLHEYYLTRKTPGKAHACVLGKKELFKDIKENGIKKIVYVDGRTMADGFSRCMIARSLGYKNIIIKRCVGSHE